MEANEGGEIASVSTGKLNSGQMRRRPPVVDSAVASRFVGSRKSSIDTTVTGVHSTKMAAPRFENTYRLGPDESKKFHAYMFDSNISELVREKLNNWEKANGAYGNGKSVEHLTMELIESIRREVKNLSLPRYRIVTHVVVGENANQDVRVTSRCLWNTDTDNYVTLSHRTKHLWASVVIYAVYFD